MKNKQFEVNIYYTGYCSYQIGAKNKNEAVKKARKLKINGSKIINSLENWEDADTAEEMKYEKRKN